MTWYQYDCVATDAGAEPTRVGHPLRIRLTRKRRISQTDPWRSNGQVTRWEYDGRYRDAADDVLAERLDESRGANLCGFAGEGTTPSPRPMWNVSTFATRKAPGTTDYRFTSTGRSGCDPPDATAGLKRSEAWHYDPAAGNLECNPAGQHKRFGHDRNRQIGLLVDWDVGHGCTPTTMPPAVRGGFRQTTADVQTGYDDANRKTRRNCG